MIFHSQSSELHAKENVKTDKIEGGYHRMNDINEQDSKHDSNKERQSSVSVKRDEHNTKDKIKLSTSSSQRNDTPTEIDGAEKHLSSTAYHSGCRADSNSPSVSKVRYK